MLKTIVEIEEMLFISKSKIKYIIKKMGILPIKRGAQNQVYYSDEQVELIKENNPQNYEGNNFIIMQSKINF